MNLGLTMASFKQLLRFKSNVFNKCIVITGIRSFSLSGVLERRIAKRDMRWNKNIPKSARHNPLLYMTEYKTGKILRIKRWQIDHDGLRRTVPINREHVHEFGIDPTHVDETAHGGSKELGERILRDESK